MTIGEAGSLGTVIEKRLEPRFEAIDQRFDQLVELIQALTAGTNRRLDALEAKVDGIDQRLDEVEGKAAPSGPRAVR